MSRINPRNRWFRPEALEGGTESRASLMCSEVKSIRERQQDRELELEFLAFLHGDLPLLGFSPSAYARTTASFTERLSLNIVQSLCSTGNAKITKNKPRPTYLTDGGDGLQRMKAEDLGRYSEGLFYQTLAYEHGEKAHHLATVFGSGVIKSFIEDGTIHREQVYPWELTIDDAAAQHPGRLQEMYQHKYVDRYVAAGWAERIEKEMGLPPEWTDPRSLKDRVMDYEPGTEDVRDVMMNATSDLIRLEEGWHLPSYKGAEDGRHVICVRGFCLVDEPWELYDSSVKRLRFPFSKVDWRRPLQGYWGVGIAKIVTGVQIEINELLASIQHGHHMVQGFWSVNKGAGVSVAHLNNSLRRIIEWSGSADMEPHYVVPNVISPEKYQHLKDLYAWGHDLSGIDEAASQGTKPVGVDAAVAMRTVGDIQTERLLPQGKNYEDLYLDMAALDIELSREIAKTNPDYMAKAMDRKELVYIKWSDLADVDDFVMKVFPTSALASTPAAKQQQVQEMMGSAGGQPLIDPDTALDLLDFPDLTEYSQRRNGWRKCVERDLARMMKDGEYQAPEPEYRVGMPGQANPSLDIARDAYNDYRSRNMPQERLELIRNYMVALRDLQAKAAPPPPPMPAPGAQPPMPGGPPGAAPPPGAAAPMPAAAPPNGVLQ